MTLLLVYRIYVEYRWPWRKVKERTLIKMLYSSWLTRKKNQSGLYNVKAITCAPFNLIFTWVSTRKPWMCAHLSGFLCPSKVAFSASRLETPGTKGEEDQRISICPHPLSRRIRVISSHLSPSHSIKNRLIHTQVQIIPLISHLGGI